MASRKLTVKLEKKRTSKLNLADSIRRHFASLGGVELKLPPREAVRPPPKFGKKSK